MKLPMLWWSRLVPLAEFVFPPVCLACRVRIGTYREFLCASCWSSVTPITPGDRLFGDMQAKLVSGDPIAGLTCLYRFEKDGPLQAMIHALKYDGATTIGVELGRRLGDALGAALTRVPGSCVVPVPLHRAKERERGYNQSDCICLGIGDVTGLPIRSDLLRRRRYTRSQTTLGVEERKDNVAGAFGVTERWRNDLDGVTILLVDDVITSGATMCACARALHAGGAGRVIACAIALAE